MKARTELIEQLKKYKEIYVMGYDSSTHLEMLINDLESEEEESEE